MWYDGDMLKLIDRLAEWWLRGRPTTEPIEIHIKNGVLPKTRIRSGDTLVISQGEMSLTDGMDLSNVSLESLTIVPSGTAPTQP